MIDNFKANMFIENDVLKFEFVDISISTNSTYIESCKITIFNRMQIKALQV